jgi:hypothetical protein
MSGRYHPSASRPRPRPRPPKPRGSGPRWPAAVWRAAHRTPPSSPGRLRYYALAWHQDPSSGPSPPRSACRSIRSVSRHSQAAWSRYPSSAMSPSRKRQAIRPFRYGTSSPMISVTAMQCIGGAGFARGRRMLIVATRLARSRRARLRAVDPVIPGGEQRHEEAASRDVRHCGELCHGEACRGDRRAEQAGCDLAAKIRRHRVA